MQFWRGQSLTNDTVLSGHLGGGRVPERPHLAAGEPNRQGGNLSNDSDGERRADERRRCRRGGAHASWRPGCLSSAGRAAQPWLVPVGVPHDGERARRRRDCSGGISACLPKTRALRVTVELWNMALPYRCEYFGGPAAQAKKRRGASGVVESNPGR